MLRRAIGSIVSVSVLVIAACTGDSPVESRPQPAAPRVLQAAVPSIVDGSSPGGLTGFYFRPPIVSSTPAGAGEFDGSLLDLLAVEICEWDGAKCVAAVRRLTSSDPLPERLRIVEGAGYYQALWQTANDRLDPAKNYRIRVLASGGELGHADVDVVGNASEADNGNSTDVVRLVNRSTLPIGFRIEKGVGLRAGAAGGTITLADGAVRLTFPPGAVPNDVFITATPATDLPGGPPTVPGTAWRFGPEGIVFAKPVTMTIAYDPSKVPPGVPEAELRIHKVVNGTFVQADAGLVDLVNHTVSAQVNGFSVYVLLQRLFPGSQQDVVGPAPLAVEVFDPASVTYKTSLTIDASATDVTVKTRITMTDNISGVGGRLFYFAYMGPSGKSRRFVCLRFNPNLAPTSGSDTNGEWECDSNWVRYTEAGTWTLRFAFVEDKVGNGVSYFQTPNGLCESAAPTARCISNPAQIVVTSSPSDVTEPTLVSLDVSPNSSPRAYGSSVSVDASATAQLVFFRFHGTDDLSGVGLPPNHDEFFQWTIKGPSGQQIVNFIGCNLIQGTTLDGFFECGLSIPRLAEVGTWRLSQILVPDRNGNGGRAFASVFNAQSNGQLCNARSNCITPPTIQVTSGGDNDPPQLQSFSISVIGATVMFTAGITDNLSGVDLVQLNLSSVAAPGQFQQCFASRTGGTATNGTFTCSLTLSQFAARGEWIVQPTLRDVAGNLRFYSRRAADGFLCYTPVSGGAQVCQNFGDTSFIVLLEGCVKGRAFIDRRPFLSCSGLTPRGADPSSAPRPAVVSERVRQAGRHRDRAALSSQRTVGKAPRQSSVGHDTDGSPRPVERVRRLKQPANLLEPAVWREWRRIAFAKTPVASVDERTPALRLKVRDPEIERHVLRVRERHGAAEARRESRGDRAADLEAEHLHDAGALAETQQRGRCRRGGADVQRDRRRAEQRPVAVVHAGEDVRMILRACFDSAHA
jgi:hypothetical protein